MSAICSNKHAVSCSALPNVLMVEPDAHLAAERIGPLFANHAHLAHATTLDDVRSFCRAGQELTLALVEIDLPGTPTRGVWQDHAGFEAVELLRTSFPKAQVCILSRHISVAYVNHAHILGASYISKLGGYENLVALANALAHKREMHSQQ